MESIASGVACCTSPEHNHPPRFDGLLYFNLLGLAGFKSMDTREIGKFNDIVLEGRDAAQDRAHVRLFHILSL